MPATVVASQRWRTGGSGARRDRRRPRRDRPTGRRRTRRRRAGAGSGGGPVARVAADRGRPAPTAGAPARSRRARRTGGIPAGGPGARAWAAARSSSAPRAVGLPYRRDPGSPWRRSPAPVACRPAGSFHAGWKLRRASSAMPRRPVTDRPARRPRRPGGPGPPLRGSPGPATGPGPRRPPPPSGTRRPWPRHTRLRPAPGSVIHPGVESILLPRGGSAVVRRGCSSRRVGRPDRAAANGAVDARHAPARPRWPRRCRTAARRSASAEHHGQGVDAHVAPDHERLEQRGPRSGCRATRTATTMMAATRPLLSPATPTARTPVTTAPTSGTKLPRPTSTARGKASGTPRMVRVMAMTIPWKAATMRVPRT